MSKETKDFSGRVKNVLVHDNESGALKQVKANDESLSKVVRPTHLLKQNVSKRTARRKSQ